MKYILIIIAVALLVCGCTNMDNYIPIEEYESKAAELEEANSKSDDKDVEIRELQKEVDTLGNSLNLTEEELEKYHSLINNLNELLSCVYYGWAINNIGGVQDGFTAFSISHNDEIYIITAGHCVENEYGKFYNFKFKSNFSDEWIYPKLLTYENDYLNKNDYAIFYSDKVVDGLDYDLNSSYPKFILGNMNNNTLREFSFFDLIDGESGSPIIDIDGEVIEIATGFSVDIDLVLEAIDNLE